MIIEGQVHGGLADGVGMALMEIIGFDEEGNCLGGSFMDYLIPTVDGGAGLGDRAHRHPVAAPPDRRQGHRRVGDRRLAAGRRQRRSSTRWSRTGCATWTCPARRRGCGRPCRAGRRRRSEVAAATVSGAGRPSSTRAPGAVRAGHRGARAAADQRARRRHRAGARRRDDRGLRRRHLRRGLGARVRPAGAVDRRAAAAAHRARRAVRSCEEEGASRSPTRACPAARWRSSSSRGVPAPRCWWSGTPRSPRRWRARPAARLRRRARAPATAPARAPDDAALVVASHGRGEEPALEAALRAGVPVRRRWSPAGSAAPRCWPRSTSPTSSAARVHSPAGLDIGGRTAGGDRAVDPRRAGRRAARGRRGPRPPRSAARAGAVDPVCGMTVAAVDGSPHADGRRCRPRGSAASGCRTAFLADPAAVCRRPPVGPRP